MLYMINIDLETSNVSGGGTDCQSPLHESLGRHFDLTVHAIDCGTHNSRSVHRPPTRYWDDNQGRGYTLESLVAQIREFRTKHPNAYARRCRSCGVEAHFPDWD